MNRNANAVITILRKTLPALRGSAYRDFIEIIQKEGWYSEAAHNKTEMQYTLFGNLIEFVSIDQAEKIRGRKRQIAFMNEANEFSYEDFFQVNIRTSEKIILDFNPSEEYSFIYDKIIPRPDCDFFQTTYKDNPFLPQDLVDEIEKLKDADEDYWNIYGLGNRGHNKELIYTHWKLVDEMPGKGEIVYGLDFGFNHPSSLVKVEIYEDACYVEEIIYQSQLTTNDIATRMKDLEIESYSEIFCDNAEPKTIEEMVRQGFNAIPCDKKSILEGIRKVKSTPLFLLSTSENLIKEIKNYKWKKDKDGNVLDAPVKFRDDGMDSMRYAIHTKLSAPSYSWHAF